VTKKLIFKFFNANRFYSALRKKITKPISGRPFRTTKKFKNLIFNHGSFATKVFASSSVVYYSIFFSTYNIASAELFERWGRNPSNSFSSVIGIFTHAGTAS